MSRVTKALHESGVRPALNFIHLLVVWALAVAQQLYDIFGQYPDFFVAHDARGLDIILLAVLLSLGLPVLIAIFTWTIGFIHKKARLWMHLLSLGFLVILIAMPVLKKITVLSDTATVFVAVLAGTAFIFVYVFSNILRIFLTYLGISVLVFPLYFVTLSPAKQLVFKKNTPTELIQPGKHDIPIIFVIFDELPLVSLMDEDRSIDAIRYPNFAALGKNAYWFRNYTVNASSTLISVPTILTGKHTKKVSALLAENHSRSIFTLLNSSYKSSGAGFF